MAYNDKVDVIAFGAFVDGKLVALAGADDDDKTMWQIGIDTLKDHRGKGLGTYLVKRIADEIIKCDAFPYYNTWGANIGSMNIALKTGFMPVKTHYFAVDIK